MRWMRRLAGSLQGIDRDDVTFWLFYLQIVSK